MVPRLIGVVLSIAVLGGGYKLVRSQTNQSSDIAERVRKRSEEIQKNNAEVRKSIKQKQNEVDGALASGVWEKYSFKDNYAKIVAKLGNDKEAMELTLSSVTISLTVRVGKTQRARGLKYTSITDTIEPVEVTISGSGDIKNSVFPVKDIDSSVPAKLAAEVRKKVDDPKAEITSMSLKRPLVQTSSNSAASWIIPVKTSGRSYSYSAKLDGSGLKKNG